MHSRVCRRPRVLSGKHERAISAPRKRRWGCRCGWLTSAMPWRSRACCTPQAARLVCEKRLFRPTPAAHARARRAHQGWPESTTPGAASAQHPAGGPRLRSAHARQESHTARRATGARDVRRTAGAADDHGHLEVAARGVVKHARVVGDLAERQQQEAHVHALHDRPQASHGSAHTHALRESAVSAVTQAIGAMPLCARRADSP